MSAERIVHLDVRPYLRKKLEPFQLIMDSIQKLNEDEVLLLHATFKPTPLLGLMNMKGYLNKVEKMEADHWITAFVHKKQGKAALEALSLIDYKDVAEPKTIEEGTLPSDSPVCEDSVPVANAPLGANVTELDNRGLEPPQPMARTLKALENCAPGDQVRIHNDRVPMFLIEELRSLGYPYSIDEQEDGSAKVTITRI